MQWWKCQTDRDWDAQHLANESIRHERLFNQSMLLSEIELTPPTEHLQ